MNILTAHSGVNAALVERDVSVESVRGKSATVEFSALLNSKNSGKDSPEAVNPSISRNVSELGILQMSGVPTHIAIAGSFTSNSTWSKAERNY